jgi:chemosensory pili system protein ChpA (sensor histidine kinase/response regulator)
MKHLETSAVDAFGDELRTSLPKIVEALDAVERNRNDLEAAHEAYRLMHALKGAASMVGLATLGFLFNAAEELLEPPVNGAAPLTDDVLTRLLASTVKFGEYMDLAAAGESIVPVVVDLAQLLGGDQPFDAAVLEALIEIDTRELASTLPPKPAPAPEESEPAFAFEMPAFEAPAAEADLDLTPAEEIPAELAEVFAQEAADHLQTIARLTAQMSNGTSDREGLQELRRAVHTLKGAAGVVGYTAASKLAHRMEDLLDRLYEGTSELTPPAVRTLASSSDALDEAINGTGDPAALRSKIGRLFGEFDTLVGALSMGVMVPSAPPESESAPTPAAENRRRGLEDRRSSGQVLRVPVRRLNDLVRAVSELVLNRSTLEQHYATLLQQVDELKFSAARIRKVAQRLETDYEVRALAGTLGKTTTKNGGYGFDELEFDRYTDFHLLTRELAETASDVATVSARVSDSIGDFDGDLTRLGRLTREIQDRTLEFRMVPLSTMTTRLERAVRVTAESCGKAVDFAISGEHVALDKGLLEHMADPLLHLLRNAVDHGIETPEARAAAGKSERGHIVVRAYHDGTDVVIEVEDDGRGLDVERIRRTAIDRGLVGAAEAAALAPEALYLFVFEPGFSTANAISEISGRGVGMDVVKSKVSRAGGRIRIDSRPGEGTRMSVRVPMTLAITRVLLVRAGGETFGLPLGAVMQIVRPHPTAIGRVGHERVLSLDGRTYPLRDLADTLGLPRSSDGPAAQPVLIANLGGRRMALAVDQIVQSRDAVVKSLGTHLRRVRGVWGATLLGDGTVVLILNAADLAGAADEPRPRVASRPVAVEQQVYNVLVVDDSLSMRHVLSTAIKRAGWHPIQARDGLDALEIMHRSTDRPDLILLDVEMPRMDGYELLSTLRTNPQYADLPIVMLTSRGGDKHRDKASALGATDYMVKPFREDVLIETVNRLVRAARLRDRKAAS